MPGTGTLVKVMIGRSSRLARLVPGARVNVALLVESVTAKGGAFDRSAGTLTNPVIPLP